MEKEELLQAYCRSKDPAVRNALAEAYLYLAWAVARRFQGRGVDMDDLRQVAAVALLQAIDRFDCSKGLAFTTFAVPTLAGALRNYLRDKSRSIRMPRRGMELLSRIEKMRESFWNQEGRDPSIEEIAQALSVSMDDVLSALEMRRDLQTMSLDMPQDEDTPGLDQVLGQEEPAFAAVEQADLIRSLLEALEEPMRAIIRLRYLAGQSQRQIAQGMGISQMQVSRLERRALETLRTRYAQ